VHLHLRRSKPVYLRFWHLRRQPEPDQLRVRVQPFDAPVGGQQKQMRSQDAGSPISACSNQVRGSRSKVIRPFATAVATSRQLIADAADARLGADSNPCGTAKLGRLANPPKPSVCIEHDHCSIYHSSNIGSTTLPWNFTLPKSFPGLRVSVGTTLATGFPRLVTISGRRVRATLSRSERQRALNSPAGTDSGLLLMHEFYDQES